jgi:DNA-binding transcriptional regulator YdaS (Cro superfamily)
MKINHMTMKQTFAALGGPTKIGNALGIRPQAVSLWVIRNQIPFERIPSLISIGKSQGIELSPDDLRSDVDWGALNNTDKDQTQKVLHSSNKDFGTALYEDRKLLGFTQEEFCRWLTDFVDTNYVVKQQALTRWENGAVPFFGNMFPLLAFLKFMFRNLGIESNVLKLILPTPEEDSNWGKELRKKEELFKTGEHYYQDQFDRYFIEHRKTSVSKETDEVTFMSNGDSKIINLVSRRTNKKTIDELAKINSEQAKEIAKLKNVIQALMA